MERRVGQRFSFLLPVSVRDVAAGLESQGFTQDVSSRGVFFFTEMALMEGYEVEITLRMPSEITLGESMPVRCRGRVLRVTKPAARLETRSTLAQTSTQTKIGVAVRFDGYEYLPEPRELSSRVSALYSHQDADEESHQDDPHSRSERPVIHASSRS